MKKEIFTSMIDWAKREMNDRIHTAEEQLFIDSVLEFALDGVDKVKSK